MTSHRLVEALTTTGVQFAASLPDSWLTGVLEALDASEAIQHIPVTREDEGVGLVAGMTLAGKRGVVVCQNAGLLVSVNALAGYGSYHGLAVPVIAAGRGGPDDGFYYQSYKARSTARVLDGIDVPSFVVSDPARVQDAARVVDMAWLHRRPAVALLTRDALLGSTS